MDLTHIRKTREDMRLRANQCRTEHWSRWSLYLSTRAWVTGREDYSPSGTAWRYFPHDHARSRAYRWNEDGLAGICDRHHWKNLVLFYEYYHGDNGRGCGASHQTGWTTLVAKLIQQSGELFAAE